MHNYMFGRLPPSFFEAWQTNSERTVARELRNADELYVLPHRIELLRECHSYHLQLPGIHLMIANIKQVKKSS